MLGSFKYFVLQEAMERERAEKVAFIRTITGVLGRGLGMASSDVNLYVQDYAEEVHHLKYNSTYKSALARKIAADIAKKREEQRLLDRVNQMTVK